MSVTREEIAEYCVEFANKLVQGELEYPNYQQCFLCSYFLYARDGQMKSVGDVLNDKTHLEYHIQNREYVTYMLVSAVAEDRDAHAHLNIILDVLQARKSNASDEHNVRLIKENVRQALFKFLARRLLNGDLHGRYEYEQVYDDN